MLGESHSNVTVLDLAHQNTLASRELAHRVTVEEVDSGTQNRTARGPPSIVEPTAGERLAQRVSIHAMYMYKLQLLVMYIVTCNSVPVVRHCSYVILNTDCKAECLYYVACTKSL